MNLHIATNYSKLDDFFCKCSPETIITLDSVSNQFEYVAGSKQKTITTIPVNTSPFPQNPEIQQQSCTFILTIFFPSNLLSHKERIYLFFSEPPKGSNLNPFDGCNLNIWSIRRKIPVLLRRKKDVLLFEQQAFQWMSFVYRLHTKSNKYTNGVTTYVWYSNCSNTHTNNDLCIEWDKIMCVLVFVFTDTGQVNTTCKTLYPVYFVLNG